MSGWIKLHRSILNWEWYDDSKTFKVWMHILLNASHNKYRYRGREFQPGQLPIGLRQLASDLRLSIQIIRTSLHKLKSTHEITLESSRQGTVITVINWEKYQTLTHELTNDQQTINTKITTTKKIKKIKNISISSGRPDKQQVKYDEIITHLNESAGKSFKSSSKNTTKFIDARLNEGFTVEEFKRVIEIKCSEWQGTEHEKYLRPQTLFGTKFESYLQQGESIQKKTEDALLATFKSAGIITNK